MSFSQLKLYIPSITVLTLAIIIGIIFNNTGLTFIEKWSRFDHSLGHGFLIVAMVVIQLFQRPYKFETSGHNSSILTGILLLTTLIILFYYLSTFWGVLIFQQFCLYALWLISIYYIFGKKYLAHISFPLFFFLFAIPFWEFFNQTLLDLTTFVSTNFIRLTDLTAFITGNRIEIPYGVIEIAHGCSGLRYFEIGLALSFFAIQNETFSLKKKILVVLFGALLGLITNWIRVIGLICIGYETKMTSSLMADHELYGFILFFVVISGVIFLTNYFAKNSPVKTTKEETIRKDDDSTTRIGEIIGKFSILLILMLTMSTFLSFESDHEITEQKTNGIDYSQNKSTYSLNNYGNYQQVEKTIFIENLECEFIQREYSFIKPGHDILPYNNIVNIDVYTILNQAVNTMKNFTNDHNVNHLLIENRQLREQTNLYYWYSYKDHTITNKYIAKLYEIFYLLTPETKMQLNLVLCPN